jgi:hypothetical protein
MDIACKLIVFFGVLTLSASCHGSDKDSWRAGLTEEGNAVVLIHGERKILKVDFPKDFKLDKSGGSNVSPLVWSDDGKMCVVTLSGSKRTFVLGFVRISENEFRSVDLSQVEDGNLGKLGRNRSDLHKVETTVQHWIKRDDLLYQVLIQTVTVGTSGKSETAQEKQLLDSNGNPIWR